MMMAVERSEQQQQESKKAIVKELSSKLLPNPQFLVSFTKAWSKLSRLQFPNFGFYPHSTMKAVINENLTASLGISVLLTFTLFFFSMKITSQLSWRITITSLTPCLEMDQSETGKINHRAENSIMEGWQVGSTRPDIQLATVSHHLECTMYMYMFSSFVFFCFCVPHPSIVLLQLG